MVQLMLEVLWLVVRVVRVLVVLMMLVAGVLVAGVLMVLQIMRGLLVVVLLLVVLRDSCCHPRRARHDADGRGSRGSRHRGRPPRAQEIRRPGLLRLRRRRRRRDLHGRQADGRWGRNPDSRLRRPGNGSGG